MGGSMVSAWPASRLIVALAVIIYLAHSFSPVESGLTLLDYLKTSDHEFDKVIGRTVADWHKRRNECITEFDTMDENQKSVVRNAIDWLKSSGDVSEKMNCNKRPQTSLSNWPLSRNDEDLDKCRKLVNEYFVLYLHKCGFQVRFNKLIESLKPQKDWDLENHKTIYSYLESKSWETRQVAEVLQAIEKITEEIDCKKSGVRSFIMEVDRTVSDGELHKFELYHFKLYLNKCGYEDHFKRAIKKLSLVSNKSWNSKKYNTLYSYLVSNSLLPWKVIGMLSAIKEISELGSTSNKMNCAQQNVDTVLKWLDRSKYYRDLHELVKAYHENYINECSAKRFV